MSNPYYPQQPQRQPAYDNPLNPPYARQPIPTSSSQLDMLSHDQDGIDYHHYHGPPPSHSLQLYHDPYATLTPADDHTRPSFSNDNLVRQTSAYSKDMHVSISDDGHDQTLRGTHYMLAKDDHTGRMGYGKGHRIDATDGLLPDVPPDMERLNPEQKEIMKQFPPDLDDEGGGKSGIQAAKDSLKNWKSWFKLKYLHWWIMLIVVIALVAFTTIYHKQIVDWLTPISKKVTTVGWGWIIPVAILFVISFPPLFGHEIVLILVGLVYGLWIGFGIAALGTLLGEIGNFYAFKSCLRSTAASYERKNIHYACMAEMVRNGGFWVMFLARLSAIPGHFTTAVFATVGMNIFIFTLAAILALPKQLLIVYLGVAIKNSGAGTEDTKSKVIKYVVLAISFIITVWTAYWLYQKMEKVRPTVAANLRRKRYELLLQARTPGTEAYTGESLHAYPPTAPYAAGAGYVYRPQQQQQHLGPQAFGSEEAYNSDSNARTDATYEPSPFNPARAPPQLSPYPAPEEHPYQSQLQSRPAPGTEERQPITAPMQFHRPLRTTAASPFQDFPPPTAAHSDGFHHPEAVPLTNANGEWASTSSLASPVDGQSAPPDYTSTYSHERHPQQQQHPRALQPNMQQPPDPAARVEPGVQRYHLSD